MCSRDNAVTRQVRDFWGPLRILGFSLDPYISYTTLGRGEFV